MSRCFVVSPSNDGARLDHVLSALCPDIGLRGRRRLCDEGKVYIRNRPAAASYRVREGQIVQLFDESDTLPAEDFLLPAIAAQNGTLAAIVKPRGLPSAHLAGGNFALEDILPQVFPHAERTSLLNRLDTGTSGLLLVGLRPEAREIWGDAEQSGRIRKRYLAVIQGVIKPGKEFVVDRALDTDNRRVSRVLEECADICRYTRVIGLAPFNGGDFFNTSTADIPLTCVGCEIVRGARHQIRAHLAYAGFPLFGDALYGGGGSVPFLLHHAVCSLNDFTARSMPDWLPHPNAAIERWLTA